MSDDDPIRWSEGGGPPGSAELVCSIERAPPLPPDLRGSIARRLAPAPVGPRTRMVGAAIATAVVIGGLTLWVWPRPVEPPPRPPPPLTAIDDALAPLAPDAPAEPAPAARVEPVAVVPPVEPSPSEPPLRRVRTPPDSIFVAPEPSIPEPSPSVPSTAALQRADEALDACVVAGDSRCVIERLGHGHAHGTAQLRLLWAAQRDVGDPQGACATARLIAASPGIPAAQRTMLQQYLRAQCDVAEAAPSPDEPTPNGTGSLSVMSMPWARLFIDGQDTGRNTPVRDLRLSAGRHVVGLRAGDGVMHETTVDVVAGEMTRVVRQL